MRQRSNYKRHAPGLGPGGVRCPCCGPAPGKDRKRAKRAWKRSEKQAAKREAERDANG